MAHHQEAVKVTPTEIKNAEKTWHQFVTGSKYAIYGTIVVLVLLALAYVDFAAVNTGHH